MILLKLAILINAHPAARSARGCRGQKVAAGSTPFFDHFQDVALSYIENGYNGTIAVKTFWWNSRTYRPVTVRLIKNLCWLKNSAIRHDIWAARRRHVGRALKLRCMHTNCGFLGTRVRETDLLYPLPMAAFSRLPRSETKYPNLPIFSFSSLFFQIFFV